LAPLASLTQLDWLVLRNLQLSDEALPQLAACRQLKRLSLQQTAYAAASLQALRSAAGQLSVDE
jgi:hypothetical protein